MRPSNENAPASSQLAQGANQNTHRNLNNLSPRLHRLVDALFTRPQTIRELIDIIPTNNPAEYVNQLRRRYGLSIPCEHVKFTTCDDGNSWYGVYSLSDKDRAALAQVLECLDRE